jgi:(2Fe-2S) ferredoxin
MKAFVLLMIAPAFFGCALTPNVDTRKPGQQWNYYGDLLNVYRDQTGGTPVDLVWLDQVYFQRVNQNEFRKVVQTYLKQGYRKIGIVSVRSQYFVDPFSVKKLAADKGARMVVGFWFAIHGARAKSQINEYCYQLLDKPAQSVVGWVPMAPVTRPANSHP